MAINTESNTIPPAYKDQIIHQLNHKDYTLDYIVRPEHVQTSGTFGPSSLPQECLGRLDALPMELLVQIFGELDLKSLMQFREVNRLAFELINLDSKFVAVRQYAWAALQAISQNCSGNDITLPILYDKLCTAECEICGEFGGYLYILTCRRVCFHCFARDERCLPLSLTRARQKYGITSDIIQYLPQMKTIPGTYSPFRQKHQQSMTVLDAESARRVGQAPYGSVMKKNQQRLSRYESWKSLNATQTRSTTRRTRLEDPYDGMSSNPLRFVAIVQMPWLDLSNRIAEWGFYCLGCENSTDWRRKFEAESFARHIEQCGPIRDGKHDA